MSLFVKKNKAQHWLSPVCGEMGRLVAQRSSDLWRDESTRLVIQSVTSKKRWNPIYCAPNTLRPEQNGWHLQTAFQNSSRDAMWWQRSVWTLAHVMGWCVTAPIHFSNQCWLLITRVPWHLPESNYTTRAPGTVLSNAFKKVYFWNDCHISQRIMS